LLDLKLDEQDWTMADDRMLTIYLGTNGYAYYSTWKDGKSHPRTLHSLIMGPTPPKSHIDHINGDKLDNRRENLRVVTPGRNQVNRHRLNRNNTSGTRGVQRTNQSQRNPWRAQITVDHKNIHLGLFATEQEAIAARRDAELLHYGELCP